MVERAWPSEHSVRDMADTDRIFDRELVKQFLAGDRDAFTALYRIHHPAVFRFMLHMTGDPARAGEITQDVFIWLIHHAGDFDESRAGLATFLSGVARKFLSRQQQMERRWMPLDEELVLQSGPLGDDAFASLSRERETAELRRAIASLPPRYGEVVILCDLEGRTYEEAAGVIGCATGTVRSRLHRARSLLARKLEWKKRERNRKVQGCSV